MQLTWENGHNIEGAFVVLGEDTDFISFVFEQPMDRQHLVSLK